MSPAALLAVYNDHFTAHMQPAVTNGGALQSLSPAIPCHRWMRTRFGERLSPPQRGMRDIDEPKAAEGGFEVIERSWFNHLVPFSRQEFVSYLLTLSNTLAAIHFSGNETHSSALDWLDGELASLVPAGITGSFIFKCNLWLLRRAPAL